MKTNPALQPFAALVGEWKWTGTHPMLPGEKLRGGTTFQWIEDGAFLLMRSTNNDDEIPSGLSIFGSDNTKGELHMLYFDEREVSRKCDVSIDGNVWKWWRSGPEFSQRYTFTLSADGTTMVAEGEISMDNGKTWEGDLSMTYTRVKK